MAENCVLYVSNRDLWPAGFLEQLAPDATVQLARGEGPADWLRLEVRWPSVRLTVQRMRRGGEPFRGHLHGFCNYVHRLAGGQMDYHLWSLIQKILKSKHVLGLTAEPAFDDRSRALVGELALAANALLFRDNAVFDCRQRLYLGPAGKRDEQAAIPDPPSAVARKERTEARLRQMGVPVHEPLPPIDADEEGLLRPPAEIARRAFALWMVAARGEGMPPQRAVEVLTDAGILDALTPHERTFLDNPSPKQEELNAATWKYECLWVLLWSLGHVPQADQLGGQCDVGAMIRFLVPHGVEDLVTAGRPRTLTEVLDLTDFVYRCHWAVKNAQVNDREPPPGLDGGVVFERHYALNWLTCYRDQDWDHVSPDT
jgi:hypothetical protein